MVKVPKKPKKQVRSEEKAPDLSNNSRFNWEDGDIIITPGPNHKKGAKK